MAAAPASLAEALARLEARLNAWAAGTEPTLWQQATGDLQSTLLTSGLAIRLELLSGDQLPGLNGSADSPGDKGKLVSALLRGLAPDPAAATENDQTWITLLSQPVLVEAAADTTAPRVNLSGFRNPAFAGFRSTAFAINPAAGAIAVNDSGDLDDETTPQFILQVAATDANGLSEPAPVTITLTNVDDPGVNERPEAQDATFTLLENSRNSTTAGTVSANNIDA